MAVQTATAGLAPYMPLPADRTSMWWEQGYPTVVKGAPWHRCVETGYYRFILDTEKLKIPHIGAIGAVGTPVDALPPAELDLVIEVDGTRYTCIGAEPVSRFVGPRLIASGTFLQRADVTGLHFADDKGNRLNLEARLETIAWPQRLGFVLAARPGIQTIKPGEASFGRVGGGYGLDGSNALTIPPEDAHTPAHFTVEFWAFVPKDFKAGEHSAWLLCKNPHEEADGHYGITVLGNGRLQARINIGGGPEGMHTLTSTDALELNEWNHLALSYDGEHLRLYMNGEFKGELAIGKPRIPRSGGLAFGNRQDQPSGGYAFRGIIDELRIYDRVLALSELKYLRRYPENTSSQGKPIRRWAFRQDVPSSRSLPREVWGNTKITLQLNRPGQSDGPLAIYQQPEGTRPPSAYTWRQAAVIIDPTTLHSLPTTPTINVEASEISTGRIRPITHDGVLGCYRIDLDGITPAPPAGQRNPSNDAIERVRIHLHNPADTEQIAALLFEKNHHGFRQRIGGITGISAILRELDGTPTGIPVQLSKNWHKHPEGGVYSGQWFHGISQVRLPPKGDLHLELTLVYGHWGGLPAASHAQLSLIGWGGNQRWDQSALGSWGESVCYEPEQVQASCTITDVRPLMVTSKPNRPQWGWTANVGGGDFFRTFDPAGTRLPHSAMQANYQRYGPCLTEVTYHGRIHGTGITHRETVSIARSNDLVCATYRIRMDVDTALNFSRLAIFQLGSDRYNPTRERKFAVGHAGGVIREWNAQWGGDSYKGERTAIPLHLPWASLHEAEPSREYGATANRALVVRKWKAVLGGKETPPHFAERGIDRGPSSIIEIVPQAGLTQLLPGDYVEATIQHLIIPQHAKDYYGPNEAHLASLKEMGNTWRMVQRQVNGDDVLVKMETGKLVHLHPDIRIQCAAESAALTLTNGIGHVPITFTGLSSHQGHTLIIDGKPLDQSVHGNDFWQTDYDPQTRTWSRTYNILAAQGKTQNLRLQKP